MKTTMPAPLALYLAAAMLAAVSRDEVTPILTAVHLEREGRSLKATATDRYRVHELTLDEAQTTGTDDVNLPASALRWIIQAMRTIAPRARDRAEATVTIQTRKAKEPSVEVTVTAANGDTMTLTTTPIAAKFPPMARMIEKAEAAEPYLGSVRVNTKFMASLAKLTGDTWPNAPRFTQTKHPELDRPDALYALYTAPGIRARALIMPLLAPLEARA